MKQHLFSFTVMSESGFSILEVILAAAIFVTFTTGTVLLIIQGFNSNRLGAEETIAAQYTAEGMEAHRSIKNQSFFFLVNSVGTGITRNASNVWAYSGALNQFQSNKYTRTLAVSDVTRDRSGSVIISGGFTDPNSKKVTASTAWSAGPNRNNSVDLTSYFTNWKADGTTRGGMLVYGDGGTSTDAVRYKIFDGRSGAWSAPLSTALTGSTARALRAARLYAAWNGQEKVLLSRHFDSSRQYIYAQVFNGSSWGNLILLSSWNSTAFLDVRNFDGTYLANGDFLAVYSDDTNIPKYRIWNGSAWSAQTNTVNMGAKPLFIVTQVRFGTNEIMLAVFDQARNTNTSYFNGSAWGVPIQHSANTPAATKQFIDFSWSPYNTTKGALIFSNGGSDRAMNIKMFTASGGSGTWSVQDNTSNQGTLGPLSADAAPADYNFLACDKDTSNDLYCFKADVSGNSPVWSTPANNIITTSAAGGIQRSFDEAFEASNGQYGIVVYGDNSANALRLKKYNPLTNSFDSAPATVSVLEGVPTTVRLIPLPGTNDIMILAADDNKTLYSAVWNGSTHTIYTTAGRTFTTHGTNGSRTTDFWYAFSWNNY